MLVGDMDGPLVVPNYPYNSYPSDHKYSCVAGTDFLSDIFVSRLSVDYMSELRVAVSKISNMRKRPRCATQSTGYAASPVLPMFVYGPIYYFLFVNCFA
jgi:hypothetical protein